MPKQNQYAVGVFLHFSNSNRLVNFSQVNSVISLSLFSDLGLSSSTDISLYNVFLQKTVFPHNIPIVSFLASLHTFAPCVVSLLIHTAVIHLLYVLSMKFLTAFISSASIVR